MKRTAAVLLLVLLAGWATRSSGQINATAHWPGGNCQAVALTDDYALAAFGGFLHIVHLADYQLISTLELPDAVRDIVVYGEIAYIAAAKTGILVVDFSDPARMKLLTTLPGFAWKLIIADGRLYVAAYGSGVALFDLATPRQPLLLGALNITPVVYDVAVSGRYLYCAGSSRGLTVIDQQDPAALKELVTLPASKSIFHLCLQGRYLYASFEYNEGLDIFDLATPTAPQLLPPFSSTFSYYQMILSGTRMFANTYTNGINVLDLSDPLHPVEREKHEIGILLDFALSGTALAAVDEWEGVSFYHRQEGSLSSATTHIELDFNALKMFTQGSTLYFPIYGGGMRFYDRTDPQAPVDRGKADWYPDDMVFNSSLAYVLTAARLYILDISTPWQPVQIAQATLRVSQEMLTLHNNRLYAYGGLYSGTYGCDVVDISTPAAPVVKEMIVHEPGFTHIEGVGNALLALDRHQQLFRIDVTDPDHPLKEPAPMLPDSVASFWLLGQTGYVTDMHDRLSIYDLSDPFHPVLHATHEDANLSARPLMVGTLGYCSAFLGLNVFDFTDPYDPALRGFVEVSSQFAPPALVSGRLALLKIIMEWKVTLYDLEHPLNPVPVGRLAPLGKNRGLAVREALAFTANGPGGLRMIGMSGAAQQQVGEWHTHGKVEDVALQGEYAYLAVESGGMHVVEIADPAHPRAVGHYYPATNGSVEAITVSGGLACLLGGVYNITILDIHQPAQPAELAKYGAGWSCQGGALAGQYLYYCDGNVGVKILDLRDPAHPTLTGSLDTPGFAHNLCIRDSLAYVADDRSSLRILNIADPAHPREIASHEITYAEILSVELYGPYAIVAASYSGVYILDISDPANIRQLANFYISGCSFVDVAVAGGYIYACDEQYGVYKLSSELITGLAAEEPLHPAGFELAQNYPNPFNMSTVIRFRLGVQEKVSLVIHDLLGRKVRSLIQERLNAGIYLTPWDGKTDGGENASSGIYFYRLKVGNHVETRRMLLVK